MTQLPKIKKEVDFLFGNINRTISIPIIKKVAIEQKNGELIMRTTDLQDHSFVKFPVDSNGKQINGAVTITKKLIRNTNELTLKNHPQLKDYKDSLRESAETVNRIAGEKLLPIGKSYQMLDRIAKEKRAERGSLYDELDDALGDFIYSYRKYEEEKERTQIYWNDVPVLTDPLDEFPEMPEKKKAKTLPIGKLYPKMLSVINLCSNEEEKLSLTGIHLYKSDRKTVIEATDGHMLYQGKFVVPNMPKVDIIIPTISLKRLKRLYKLSDDISFQLAKPLYLFSENEVAGMVSKMIDDRFPDVDSVLDDYEHKHICYGNTKLMLETLKYIREVAPLSEEKTVVLNKRKLFAEDTETELSCTFDLPMNIPIKIGFNLDYLIYIMKAIESEKFSWKFRHPNVMSIIQPVGMNEQFVIMPMRIGE